MANTTGYGYLLGPAPQFFDANGKPLVGGKLFVYIAGTTTKAVTYSDFYKTENTNPVVLNDLGTCMLIVPSANLYKIVLYDRKGNLLITRDNVSVSSEHQIIYMTANKVDSSDSTVDVTATTDPDTGIITYDLSIKDEIDRAKEAEKGLADAIEAEKKRAEGVESTLSKSIADETKRATEAEKGLSDAIVAEKNRAEEAERTISESISKETERAIAAENASRTEIVAGDKITVEKTVGADGQDVYTVSGESKDNLVDDVRVNGESVVTDKVANIDVPVAGTASPLMDGNASVGNSLKYAREDHVHPSDTSREDISNKTTVVLGTSDSKYPTDKAVAEFVNSSIATNTANYISNNGEPFTSVEQLEAYSGPVTNNDYAFVTGTDSDGNTYYDRYKATVSGSSVTWALEYRLNNSSFTAAQWSAINSGITSVLVAKIHDHGNKDVLDGITSDKVTSWDGKEDAFDVLPTTKGGTGTNAASKSALTSSLINSLSTELSKPVDADYYVSQYQNGGTSNTSFVRRPVSALWEYIKDKISSVLRLTASDYAGKAATAGTADKAVADNSGNNIEETYATKTELSTHTDTLVKATAKTDNVNYKILATASASPTSGNATEAVYDTDISLNPSTNTITSNISGNAATATKPAVTTLTASDNLNNVGGSTAGDVLWYKWASGSAPANVPIAGAAVMEVVRTHSNKYITQTVYTADHSVYRRDCINGTWSSWYAYSKSTHTHGNITSGGALQTTDVAIANGDKLVITDASDSNKVARSSTAFDGSTTTKALTQKGTFEAFAKSGDITTAIQALDVSSVGGDGKYISAISETDGKISAAATTMDTTPTADSTKAVTSGGIKTALDDKFDKYGFFGNSDGKWIGAALSVSGETEVKYWKLCSFTTSNYWALNFVADVTNAYFDSNVFERKIIAICGKTSGVVSLALEIREGNNQLYSSRGYGNIIYYETSGDNVTIYIKARFAANVSQFCRLVSVLSLKSISKLTWYQETTAGTQPKNPVKFSLGYKTVKPAGSTSVPVYIGSDGNPTACTDDFVHDGDVTSTYSSTGTAPVNGKAVAAAIGGLDVSSVGGDGKYISAISETDGKISATATTMDTTPTAGSTNPVTSEGIRTALEVLQSNIDTANAKGIVINEIDGENVICFE